MTNQIGIEETMKLIKLKKDNPEFYQEFLEGLVDITLDLMEVNKKVMKKLEEEGNNPFSK